MHIISSTQATVVYDTVAEQLYAIRGQYTEMELYERGFIDFHEDGGYTLIKHGIRPLDVPEDAYSTLYTQGTRFRLKDGTPMAKPQPCPESYQLSDLVLANLNAQYDDADAKLSRAEYQYTRWGSYDQEKIDHYVDPFSGATFSAPHGFPLELVDRAKLIECQRQRSWSVADLEKIHQEFANQWFADWAQWLPDWCQ